MGFRVLGLRFQDLGFGVQDLGFRVQGFYGLHEKELYMGTYGGGKWKRTWKPTQVYHIFRAWGLGFFEQFLYRGLY